MALTATATKLQTLLTTGPSSGNYGVISQADGSYVAGIADTSDTYPYPSTAYWFRSLNQGRSWSQISTTDGIYGEDQYFHCNVTQNIVLAPFIIPASNSMGITRSTDGGTHWTTVFSASPAGSPPSRLPFARGISTFQKTHAIAWGILSGDGTPPVPIYALSSDSGASWTPVPTFDSGDKDDTANACGIAENGTIYLQYTKLGGINRTSNFARSDDFASTWTTLGALPGGTGHPPNEATAITCFDANNIAIAGVAYHSGGSAAPGVWYSDDAGATLHQLAGSDIDDWPGSSGNDWCYEVKRLTREACILSLAQENAGPGSPWRISLDKGHTYPISVTPSGTSWQTYQIPFGKIVTARDGGILALLWQSNDYGTVELSAFRIEIVC